MRPGSPTACIALLPLAILPAAGAVLEVRVEDAKGRPVADAVVAATPVGGTPAAPAPGRAIIDQVDEQFVPQVVAIRAGTSVSFPNRDDVRHHVYSFSEAKKFELPLYKGTPAAPVVFDRPGLVVLGCNIHDWMLAYVYVLETPHFAITGEDGLARIEGLAGGAYDVVAQHPRAKQPPGAVRVTVSGAEVSTASFQVHLKPDFRRSGAPRAGGRDY